MKVKDYMTKGVISCDIDDEISAIAQLMDENDVGFLAVLDEEDVVGVLTDLDLVIGPIKENARTIEDFIQKDIISIEQEQSVEEALKLMRENRIKRLLVTKNGKYTGVLSIFDLLNANCREDFLYTLEEIKG